jgi:D-glycero-alpha-D-manno-heptose-7-phosphate kinase
LEASLILYYTGVSRESAGIISEQIEHARRGDGKNIEGMHEMKRQAVLMKEALLKGDFESFSRCILNGWQAKKNAASTITNSFLDDLYSYALSNGAESAKISGAGGGGFMMIYCNPRRRFKLIQALKEKGGSVLAASFTEIWTQAWTIYKT